MAFTISNNSSHFSVNTSTGTSWSGYTAAGLRSGTQPLTISVRFQSSFLSPQTLGGNFGLCHNDSTTIVSGTAIPFSGVVLPASSTVDVDIDIGTAMDAFVNSGGYSPGLPIRLIADVTSNSASGLFTWQGHDGTHANITLQESYTWPFWPPATGTDTHEFHEPHGVLEMLQTETEPRLYFWAFEDDGTPDDSVTASTTGLTISAFRSGESATSLTPADASSETDWAAGKLFNPYGNFYWIGCAASLVRNHRGTIYAGGTYTGGRIFGITQMVTADPNLLQTTTIATVTSQTEITLTAGSADDDAYDSNCVAIFTDQTTGEQKSLVAVSDYVGSTKTLTLAEAPDFTIAVGDTVDIVLSREGSGGLDAAGIRAAIGLASANLDTQLSAIPTSTLDAAGVRSAVGLSSANLDTQLAGISNNSPMLLETTISTVNSQTSLVLAAGVATNDYYNGKWVTIIDADASTTRTAGKVSDWAGASKTLTLDFTPGFTVATSDTVLIHSEPVFEFTTDEVAVGSLSSGALSSLASSEIEVIGVFAPGGFINLIKGDDYINDELTFTETASEDWPALTDATVTFEAIGISDDQDTPTGDTIDITGSVTTATGSAKVIVFNSMTRTVTAIAAGTYNYHIIATMSDGERRTLRHGPGKLTIHEDYAVPDA